MYGFSYLIVPIFATALIKGVKSQLWRAIFIALVGLAWYAWGPATVAVQVALIIGIALKNSLKEISGTPL